MNRSKPLLRTQPDTATLTIKPKACKVCRARFVPLRPMQIACTPPCALEYAKRLAEGKAKAQRKSDKAKRESLKRLPELRAEAQAMFNAYIRARDQKAGYGCICCGSPLEWHSGKPGGSVDAGHYMARGGSPALAFDERNTNAQRKSCNRPGGTTRDAFRAGMLERWGAAVVAELEGPHEPKRYRADDYRRIKAEYAAKIKEMG